MTSAKEPITAKITITRRGRAEVLFQEPGISGEIVRQGVQCYLAFTEGHTATGARYESAARRLAASLGLLKRHVVYVEITDGVPSAEQG